MFLSDRIIYKWASNRKTSFEVAQSILELATDFEHAARIWESPTRHELRLIADRASQHGVIDPNGLFWGFASLTTILQNNGLGLVH